MKKSSIAKFLFFSVLSFGVVSCEEDFTEIGSEVIDSDPFGFDKYVVQNISVENEVAGISNTRNLPINNFGIYTESGFGKTKAHFVSQIEMPETTSLSSIGDNPVLDSVYVYIPYKSTVASTDSEGGKTYNLTDVYGSGRFGLNVYENGYFLRNSDPNNSFETQFFYADDKGLFDTNKKGINGSGRLNNSAKPEQNNAFFFNKNEIKLFAFNEDGTPQKDDNDKPKVKERLVPGVWLDLDKAYFQSKFFSNNQYKSIANNGELKNFFRGLYFEVVDSYNEKALAQLDLSAGKLVFVYKQDNGVDAATNKTKRARKTLEFKLGYNSGEGSTATATTVNLIESNFVFNNNSAGNIWLKGGAKPTYSEIHLFGKDVGANGKPDELNTLINKDWLVNQAVLTMYVDHAATGLDTVVMPKQLYLYDFKNNKVIADYINDTGSAGKPIYGGFLNTSNKSVYKYQFRVTDHINNLIKRDSTNSALGLVVASDIANSVMNVVKGSTVKIPLTATMNPFGTVIYGPNAANNELKMKLEIYYTKENN